MDILDDLLHVYLNKNKMENKIERLEKQLKKEKDKVI